MDPDFSLIKSDFAPNYVEALRFMRNMLLRDSDWTQFNDSPLSDSKKTEWATYRQSLRDITSSSQSIFSVTWPTEPS